MKEKIKSKQAKKTKSVSKKEILETKKQDNKCCRITDKYFLFISAFLCFALFAFNFWLFWPGYIMHDWIWIMTDFNMSNHHPVMYPLLFKYIAKVFGNHVYVPLLFNLVPFYLGIYFIILGCYKKFQSKWCLLCLLPIGIANIFFNNILMHSSYSSPMLVFLLWAVVLYQILAGITRKNMLFAGICFLFALLSRHNAIFQVYPVFFVYAYFMVKNTKQQIIKSQIMYAIWLLLFAGFTLMVAIGLPALLKDKSIPAFPANPTFLHQIASVCLPHHDESCFKSEWYREGKTYEDIKKAYNPTMADYMSAGWYDDTPLKHEKLNDLHLKWIQAIVKYPADYWTHISHYISEMWFSDTTNYQFIFQGCRSDNNFCWLLDRTFDKSELYYKPSPFKIKIYDILKSVFINIKTIWFVSLNFVLFIIYGIVFFKKRDELSLYILSASIAGIAAQIMFCAFSPVTDTRYIYPVLITTVMAVMGGIIQLCENKRNIVAFVKENTVLVIKMIVALELLLIGGVMAIDALGLCSSYARIEIFNEGTKENSVEITNFPNYSSVTYPTSFKRDNGQGGVVQYTSNGTSMRANIKGDGKLIIYLRGMAKEEKGKIYQIPVTFTSLKINGKEVLPQPVTVTYENYFTYAIPVKDGEIIDFVFKWKK